MNVPVITALLCSEWSNMRRILPAFLVLVAGGALGYTAHAQWGSPTNNGVPEIITYRGYLEDSTSGTAQPVTGTKTMTFSIHTAASGGTQLWICNSMSVPVLGGHFEVQLGTGGCPFTSASTPKLFDRPELYLQISVDTVPLTTRQRITASPYAVAAAQANNMRVSGALTVTGTSSLGAVTASSLTSTGAIAGNFQFTVTSNTQTALAGETKSVDLTSTSRSFCYLSTAQDWGTSGSSYCQVTIDTSTAKWRLGLYTSAGTKVCTARCLSW